MTKFLIKIKYRIFRIFFFLIKCIPRFFFGAFITKYLQNLKMFFLRRCGAKVGKNSFVRHDFFIINPHFLKIGDNSIIGDFARIYNFDLINIGDNVEIGPQLTMLSYDHIIEKPKLLSKQGTINKPIFINNNCYIGANVTILSGVTIREEVIVGAGSLVNRNLESGYIYAGVPVKKLKKISNYIKQNKNKISK